MADLRTELVEAMNGVLASHTTHVPQAIPIAVPTGKLADAALEALTRGGGVPRVPAYEPELFAQRRWHQPLSADALDQAAPAIAVDLSPDGRAARLSVGYDSGMRIAVDLPPRDAQEVALSILAVTAAANADSLTGDLH